jgi:putative transposase
MGEFISMLTNKAESAGRTVEKVPPHGTTQECSRCGTIVKKNLSVRVHSCPHCGLVLDRDHNAAINKKLGRHVSG